ncbi:collagen alpha-1(XII) chain [Anabrus simplex]|uniref:collagen alpha-1(XII) chain n=1 Tax=Anabrus simplex TaxID=316456 RepID=UPI0035A265AB
MHHHLAAVPDIWTGGRLQEHRWFWELSGEEVLSMKDDEEFPIWIGEPHDPQFGCMALDSQVAGQPRFADRDCSIPKPFVCESGCLPLTQARRGQWSRSECLSRVGMRDEVCELSCYEGFELWGSRRLVCSKSGWNGTKPQCVTPDKLAYEFVERLNATLDAVVERLQSDQLLGTGILFVIGKTTTLGHAGYDQITEFLKATVAAVRLSPSQVSAGVITYGPEVVLEIPLNTSDTCDFIDQADQMLYDHSGDNVDLQEALSHAKEHIEKTGLYERTVIVLITDADSTEDSTEVITELKSLGHKFFAIGIGTSVSIENLEAIASKPISPVETTPNFYLLSSLHTFGNMVSYLNETYLYNSDLDCCMLLHVPAHGQWEPAQCSERPGNLHDTCSILCEEGYELVGDLKLTCTEHGWYGENGKGHIPSCHSVVMVTRSMFDRMDETLAPLDNVGILFLVDQSTSMSILDFQEQTAFVKMIVNKFSLSKTRTAGLITFNTKASVKVPLNTSDTCSFLVTLDQLSFQGGGTSFSAALQAAEEEISLHGENSTIVLFLMTDGRSYGNPKVVADRLKADGHIIFTLGVGGYNRRQLEALASVGPNQRPQFFSLADFEALKTAVSYINSTLMRSSEKHCCLKLDPDVSGVWDPPNCAVAPSEEHDVCYLTCDPGYELFGSDQLSCSADGWGATMPTCFAKPDLMGSIILYQLKDLLELKEESASIVFLVDHTDTLNHESFDMLTEFIKLLASRFSLSSELTAGMIVSYKYGNDIEIPFNTNNTCTFLSNLDKIRREKGSPSLSRALRLIRKLSDSPYDEEQNMIIVLLTDRQAITKPSVSLAKKLKNSGNSILVIGINNRVVYNDLFKIASGEKQPNNMVIIDTYDTLESVTDYLTDGEKQLAWYSDTGYSAPDC